MQSNVLRVLVIIINYLLTDYLLVCYSKTGNRFGKVNSSNFDQYFILGVLVFVVYIYGTAQGVRPARYDITCNDLIVTEIDFLHTWPHCLHSIDVAFSMHIGSWCSVFNVLCVFV